MSLEPEGSLDELLALYVIGALTPAEQAAVEEKLAEGWPEAEAELLRLQGVIPAITGVVRPQEPPARLRHVILERISEAPPRNQTVAESRLAALAMPDLKFVFRDDGQFTEAHEPGVYARILHVDRVGRRFSAILTMAAGARLSSHHHDGMEECLVLQGELILGGVRMRAGDYQRAESGSDHVEQWTDTGATVLLMGPTSLLQA